MLRPFAIIIFMLIAFSAASAGITIGLGFDYIPFVKMQYVNNPSLDLDIVDNIAWHGRVIYDFENGLRAGSIFNYYKKGTDENGFRSIKLTQWGIGLTGDYSYDITESGTTFLVGGMETGYGELSDRTAPPAVTVGSIWVGGLAGLRFHVVQNFWCELDYRLIYLEYEINGPIPKKYLFSGSSLRLTLEYPLSGGKGADEGKGAGSE
jgi:hypothetical protein